MIKILNSDIALKLSEMGFNYYKEKMGVNEVYVFVQTEKIMRVLNQHYSESGGDYFIDRLMLF